MAAEKIRLIAPSLEMKHRVAAFRKEFFDHGEQKIYGSCGLHHYERVEDWLGSLSPDPPQHPDRELLAIATGRPEHLFPASTFFAIRTRDDVIVGVTNIRHYIDEAHYHNGHIGYSVRPSERRKGYGTELLRLALIKAEQLGVIEPVVTCNKGNIGSKRVIERNKLAFEQEFLESNGNRVLIYRKPL